MADNSVQDSGLAETARPFFETAHAALVDSLKTLCQDQAKVGDLQIVASPEEAGAAAAGDAAFIQASLRGGDGKGVSLFLPTLDAIAMTGLSMYETADEIEAKRSAGTLSEDDLDGLKSLADQVLSAIATAARAASGGEFAFDPAVVECKEYTAEDVTALLPSDSATARVPLTIDPYEPCSLLFSISLGATVAPPKPEPAPEPAPAATASAPPAAAPERIVTDDESVERILKIPVPVIVLLAETKASTEDVLQITEGTVIQFSKGDEERLDLLINNKKVGRGTVVKIGKKLGLRIEEIGDAKEIIKTL